MRKSEPERGRITLGLTPFEFGVFVAYGMMLAVFGPMHEPWADEAQAWMLARDNRLFPLLFHYLRHEGHPALWYIVLRGATLLHWSYSAFWVLSCAFALAGVWVLERYAPFPKYLKLLLPFTFYLGYQYSVVARSYVLFPLLGFWAAHLYRLPRARPVAMAVALGLLANVSVHGTLVALAFAVLYSMRLRRMPLPDRPAPRELWTGALLFAASIGFVAVCLWPTVGALPRVSPTLNRIIDAVSVKESVPAAPSPAPAPTLTPPAAAATATPIPATATPTPAPGAPAAAPGKAKLRNLQVPLSYSFADWWPLALAFDILVIVYLWRRRQPGLIAPFLLLFAFLAMVYSAPWHFGLLWITMLMVLWAVWNPDEPPSARLQNAVALSLALLCVLQLPWTFRAFKMDAREPTAPDLATARYLKTLPPGTRIADLGLATGVQPYFRDKVYFNLHYTFVYFAPDPQTLTPEQTVAAHPDVIVSDPLHEPTVLAAGYRQLRTFCGTMPVPHGPPLPGCLIINLPGAAAAP